MSYYEIHIIENWELRIEIMKCLYFEIWNQKLGFWNYACESKCLYFEFWINQFIFVELEIVFFFCLLRGIKRKLGFEIRVLKVIILI